MFTYFHKTQIYLSSFLIMKGHQVTISQSSAMRIHSHHKCFIPSCTIKARRAEPNLSWHSVKNRHEQWTDLFRVIERHPNWVPPGKHSAICSRHFEDEHFNEPRGLKALKTRFTLTPNAYPTLNLEESDEPPQNSNDEHFVDSEEVPEINNEGKDRNEHFVGGEKVNLEPHQVTCPKCLHMFSFYLPGGQENDYSPPRKRSKIINDDTPVASITVKSEAMITHETDKDPLAFEEEYEDDDLSDMKSMSDTHSTETVEFLIPCDAKIEKESSTEIPFEETNPPDVIEKVGEKLEKPRPRNRHRVSGKSPYNGTNHTKPTRASSKRRPHSKGSSGNDDPKIDNSLLKPKVRGRPLSFLAQLMETLPKRPSIVHKRPPVSTYARNHKQKESSVNSQSATPTVKLKEVSTQNTGVI